MSSRIFQDIIQAKEKATAPAEDARAEEDWYEEPSSYQAYRCGHFGQDGFIINLKNGECPGIHYHDIRHPLFKRHGDADFLTFTYDGMAITLQGNGLRKVLQAIMQRRLMDIYEHNGQPVELDAPIVKRIAITKVEKESPGRGDGFSS